MLDTPDPAPKSSVSLADRLAANPDGVLEQLAADHGVSTLDVVQALPDPHRLLLPGSAFDRIMQDLTAWGEVLVIVHTADLVLECAGAIPPGTHGRGYFNLHGESPIGGHIRAANCQTIALINRPFMGRPSLSIQFFNARGDAMFKVFVRRDRERNVLGDQVARFQELWLRNADTDRAP